MIAVCSHVVFEFWSGLESDT